MESASASVASPRLAVHKGDEEAMQRVMRARFDCKRLKPDPIPDETLKSICAMAQRAPSSFNTQPYKIIVVKSPEARERLSHGMLGPENQERVKAAPVTFIFCADLQTVDSLPKIQKLWREHSTAPTEYVEKHIPFGLMIMSIGFKQPIRLIATLLLRGLLGMAGFFKPVPAVVGSSAWAFKQVGFVADHVCLASASYGLGSACMEGLSSDAIRQALKIPRGYVVMCAVSVGYPDMEQRWSVRFPPEEVFSEDVFDRPYVDITPLSVPASAL